MRNGPGSPSGGPGPSAAARASSAPAERQRELRDLLIPVAGAEASGPRQADRTEHERRPTRELDSARDDRGAPAQVQRAQSPELGARAEMELRAELDAVPE